MSFSARIKKSRIATLFVVLLLSLAFAFQAYASGSVPNLSDRFDQMSTSAASATATHLVGFTINETSYPLGSIELQFCSNDPLPNYPCTTPAGMDVSNAQLVNQTGNTGFVISPLTTSTTLILTRTPANPFPLGIPNTYQFSNVVNPSNSGTYYIRVYIFQSTDATGTATEDGGIAFAINGGLNVKAEVPPYLKFCVAVTITNNNCLTATNFLMNMGNFSTKATAISSSQFVVGTNAQSGYNVTVDGTTLTSGNNIIPSLPSPASSVIGLSQFGINLRANTLPQVGQNPTGLSGGSGVITSSYNIPNKFMFNSGDILTSSSSVSNSQTFTVSYITNVSSSQAPGVYATTLSFICLANF